MLQIRTWLGKCDFAFSTLLSDLLLIIMIAENMYMSTCCTGLTSMRQNYNLCIIDPQLCVIGNTVLCFVIHSNVLSNFLLMSLMMADISGTRIFVRLMVSSSSSMLVCGCRIWFLMRKSYCSLDRRRFGLRMIGMLYALSTCDDFSLRLHASLPKTYN